MDVTEILRLAQDDINKDVAVIKKHIGGRRNGRWQDSCNPFVVLLQTVTRLVAGVYAVWVKQ